tara:strand:- start:1032 stop:1364 length:333 start_codon:yes stop_codon:yes gene_type:complete
MVTLIRLTYLVSIFGICFSGHIAFATVFCIIVSFAVMSNILAVPVATSKVVNLPDEELLISKRNWTAFGLLWKMTLFAVFGKFYFIMPLAFILISNEYLISLCSNKNENE